MTPAEIAIAVVEHKGHFLVGERAAGAPLAGHREFPGGKVRSDESPALAAERECWEEAGIQVRAQRELLVVEHDYPHGAVRLRFFKCQLASDDPPRAPFQWIERRQLAALRFPEANRAILNMLAADEHS